ncbi:MAG: DUF1376 domain-containing protein [Acetobacter papayae]|uniref:YdaU family protein n=1 Tax=Acetobacter papayae TaxID=1076592 RepID=UPI0039EADDA6
MSKIKTWMPVYIGDYLADTMRLSTLQHGAYFLLMMEYWRQGPLPDDMDELSAIARADRKVWDKSIWPTLKRFFSKGEDGLLHQKRADIELERVQSISNKRREAVGQRRDRTNEKDQQDGNKSSTNEDTNVSDLNVQTANKEGDTRAVCASALQSQSHISSLRSDIPPVTPPKADKPEPRGRRLPEDWQPSHEDRSFALGLGLNPTDIAAQFADWWRAQPAAKGRKADWSATWRNWCRRDAERRGSPKATSGKPQSPLSQQFERMQRQYGDRTVA